MVWKKLFSFGKSTGQKVNLEETGFSEEALSFLERNSHSKLMPFYKKDLYSDKAGELAGICIETCQEEPEYLILKLNEDLHKMNYQAFICDFDRQKIGVIKGNNQFEILKLQQTNGENYDISNSRVISKLKEWYRNYPFNIIGADYDWVEVEFVVLPKGKELKALAREIAEFCPDIVEQGAGSIDDLIEEINETRKLSLWWD